MSTEERSFHEAFAEMSKSDSKFQKPILTIIVVQRTSNYRIVPQKIDERAPPARQNVASGTVVDRDVMHPTQTEFLLVAQKAIQVCFLNHRNSF